MVNLPTPAVQLAESQLGVIARSQLRRWMSPGAIDGLRNRGSLEGLERGVYRVVGGARLPEQMVLAAALRAGSGAMVTGPFVLGDLRVDGFGPDDPFEILVPEGRRLRNVQFLHRRSEVCDREFGARGEVRLATPGDALIDAALHRATVGDRALRIAYDHLRWRGLLSTSALRARLVSRGGSDPAVQAFRHLFGDSGLISESEGERLLAPVLTRIRPRPVAQVWVTPNRRIDWYLRELRIGWEYLGSIDHASADRRRADASRDTELGAFGIRLLYVTARDLDDPLALLATTMSALVVRAEELGVAAPILHR